MRGEPVEENDADDDEEEREGEAREARGEAVVVLLPVVGIHTAILGAAPGWRKAREIVLSVAPARYIPDAPEAG